MSLNRPSAPRCALVALAAASFLCGACDKREKQEKPQKSGPAPASTSAEKEKQNDKDKPSAKEAAKIIEALPPAEQVADVVNPQGLEPYSGPTGAVRGIVRATGDPAPELEKVLKKIEPKCARARGMYGVLFREGENRELADVLVAVTQYKGYVPADGVEVEVWGKGCAWDSRTIAMTYGQRLQIDGVDNRPYVPELLGQPMPAQLFVLPTAPPVKIPPKKPGRYQLVDSMRLYNVAEVFALPYATVDVTGTDGRFEIDGIPAGDVKINALLPQTGATVGKSITIEPNGVTEVEFELPFDRAVYDKAPKPTPLDELPSPGGIGR